MFDYLRLLSLFKKHPSEMEAIFRVPVLSRDAFSKFSEEKVLYAFSLTDEDWVEWDALLEKAKKISQSHKLSFSKYLQENWKTKSICNLTLQELRLVCGEPESTWKELDEIQNNIALINQSYSDGLSSFMEQHGSCSAKVISKNFSLIVKLQERYNAHARFEQFMEAQTKLCQWFSSNKVKTLSSSLRSHVFKMSYDTSDKIGHLLPVSIDLNVVYRLSFSPNRLNEQSPNLSKVYGYIAKLNTRSHTFTDAIYDESLSVIKEIHETEGDRLFVLLNSYGNYFDLFETYDYHYEKIKSKLSEYNISYGNFDSIDWKESHFSCIVVYNLFSSDQELSEQLSEILGKTTCPPKVLFLSVMHQYNSPLKMDNLQM